VEKLYVDAGDRVKAGHCWRSSTKEQIEAQVRQARAALERAEANMHAAEADHRRARLMQPDTDFRL